MKIYSEILNKLFDTEDECIAAEEESKKQKEIAETEKKAKDALVSKQKKELSTAVEEAETKLTKAYEDYEKAKEEVRQILEESNKQCQEILAPAKDAIKKAQQERYEAINAFNNKFGTYTAYYTGDKAYQELKRAAAWLDSLFNRLW